jgi:hypothetical protein
MADQIYASESTIAKMLGHDRAWLHANACMLEQQYGFPKIDPAIGKRHRPSVEAWASERNTRKRLLPHKSVKTEESLDDF